MTTARWDHYALCRLYGHAWEEVPGDWTPAFGGVPVTLRCMRCVMERRDTLGANTGELNGRRYLAPEGYYWQRDSDLDERPTRQDYRLGWIERHMAEARKVRQQPPSRGRRTSRRSATARAAS